LGFAGTTCQTDTLSIDVSNPFIRNAGSLAQGGTALSANVASNTTDPQDHSTIQQRLDQLERVNAIKQAYDTVQDMVRDTLTSNPQPENPTSTTDGKTTQDLQQQILKIQQQQAAAIQKAAAEAAQAVLSKFTTQNRQFEVAQKPNAFPNSQPIPSSSPPSMFGPTQATVPIVQFAVPTNDNPTPQAPIPFIAKAQVFVGPMNIPSTQTRDVKIPGEARPPPPNIKIEPNTITDPGEIHNVEKASKVLDKEIQEVTEKVDAINRFVPHHHH